MKTENGSRKAPASCHFELAEPRRGEAQREIQRNGTGPALSALDFSPRCTPPAFRRLEMTTRSRPAASERARGTA